MWELIRKAIGYGRGWISSFFYFQAKGRVCQRGKLKVDRYRGKITVGAGTWFWPEVYLGCEGVKHNHARLEIGNNCHIGDRTEIHCADEIIIEDNVIISWNCHILDRDYHSSMGGEEGTAPVRIKNGAWIGLGAIILKGVTVGEGAIIAAGAVVSKDVPDHHLAAGNPAVIKHQVKGYMEGEGEPPKVSDPGSIA